MADNQTDLPVTACSGQSFLWLAIRLNYLWQPAPDNHSCGWQSDWPTCDSLLRTIILVADNQTDLPVTACSVQSFLWLTIRLTFLWRLLRTIVLVADNQTDLPVTACSGQSFLWLTIRLTYLWQPAPDSYSWGWQTTPPVSLLQTIIIVADNQTNLPVTACSGQSFLWLTIRLTYLWQPAPNNHSCGWQSD